MNRSGLIAAIQPFGGKVLNESGTHLAVTDVNNAVIALVRNPRVRWSDKREYTPETAHLPDPFARELVADSPADMHTFRMMKARQRYARDARSVRTDPALSEAEKAKRIEAMKKPLIDALLTHAQEFAEARRKHTAAHAALYALPADDSRGPERRGRYHSAADPRARTQFVERIIASRDPAAIAALLHDKPLLEPRDQELLSRAWRESVEERNPQRSHALRAETEAFEQGEQWVHEIARTTVKVAEMTPAAALATVGDHPGAFAFSANTEAP